ncbi:MAG: queuosine salvage family protein [Candidatus Sericytochromatia bacterium]|nr:queuosine salvage family protein [Candidatus Sericytochromatia bacterium]
MAVTRGLEVIEGARWVMAQARHVRLDAAGLEAACAEILRRDLPVPAWNDRWHFTDGTWRTANYLLVLDALNFSFWAAPGEVRWGIEHRGEALRGYWALAAALTRAIEGGVPLFEATFMATCPAEKLAGILAGRGTIPLFEARLAHLHEVGQGLLDRWGGRFDRLVAACDGSAVTLAARLPEEFPSFRDESPYKGRTIRLAKRAQILPADLWGAFGGRGPGAFHDIDQLTAFADYKVPQVLEALGVLRYDAGLVADLEAHAELPPHSEAEVELRAATLVATDALRERLAAAGRPLTAVELDWILWELGLAPDRRFKPYHLTRTTAY